MTFGNGKKMPWGSSRASDKDDKEKLKAEILTYSEQGKKPSEIALLVNRTRQTVHDYQTELVKEGKLKRDPNTKHLVKTEQQKAETTFQNIIRTEFGQIPTIQKFIERAIRDKVQGYEALVSSLYVICKTQDKHPDFWLGEWEIIEAEFHNFEKRLFAGEAKLFRKTHAHAAITSQSYRKAIRNFRLRHNKFVPHGLETILNGKKERAGAYSQVQLTHGEIYDQGAEWIEKNFGFEAMAVTLIGHEIFPRTKTLLKWIPKFEYHYADVDGHAFEYATCSVFESKTEKSHPDPWDKLILHPKVIKISKEITKGKPIFSESHFQKTNSKFNQIMREYYAHLGKIQLFDSKTNSKPYANGTEEWHFYNKPAYTLRHSGSHEWMRRTDFNATSVALMGWEDVSTLVKFYAKAKASRLMQQGVCYYHNPPIVKDDNNPIFCSPLHSLAYMNNGHKSQKDLNAGIESALSQITTIAEHPLDNLQQIEVQTR